MSETTRRWKWKIRRFRNALRLYMSGPKQALVLNASIDLRGNRLKHRNFGDDLNYYLLRELTPLNIFNSFNLADFVRKRRENVLAIGSLVEWKADGNSIVWGSGAIKGGNEPLGAKPKEVRAVRGPLTRRYLLEHGVDCPEVYGDPALLLPYVYAPEVRKRYRLGIIPHYVDLDNPYVRKC